MKTTTMIALLVVITLISSIAKADGCQIVVTNGKPMQCCTYGGMTTCN